MATPRKSPKSTGNVLTPANPTSPRKRILLCVMGMTPQVVTETVYALGKGDGQGGDKWFADEVHIITTDKGAVQARLSLMGKRKNQLANLCRDYGWRHPKCDETTLHRISDDTIPNGDTRDAQANKTAANVILRVVRELTSPEVNNEIHFSIAGGRKTMTFLLGYCASLLSNRHDRMSHVLVNAPFENLPKFFYPPRVPDVIEGFGNTMVDTSEARVALAEVPFIRLREQMPKQLLDVNYSYVDTVKIVDSMLSTPRLTLRIFSSPNSGSTGFKNEVEIAGGIKFTLPAKSFALYWLLAKHQVSMETTLDPILADYYPVYLKQLGKATKDELAKLERDKIKADAQELKKFIGQLLDVPLHKLNQALKKELGTSVKNYYNIEAVNPTSEKRQSERTSYTLKAYRVKVPVANITFEGESFLTKQ